MVDAIFPCCDSYSRPEGCDAGILILILVCITGSAAAFFFAFVKYKEYYQGYRQMKNSGGLM